MHLLFAGLVFLVIVCVVIRLRSQRRLTAPLVSGGGSASAMPDDDPSHPGPNQQ